MGENFNGGDNTGGRRTGSGANECAENFLQELYEQPPRVKQTRASTAVQERINAKDAGGTAKSAFNKDVSQQPAEHTNLPNQEFTPGNNPELTTAQQFSHNIKMIAAFGEQAGQQEKALSALTEILKKLEAISKNVDDRTNGNNGKAASDSLVAQAPPAVMPNINVHAQNVEMRKDNAGSSIPAMPGDTTIAQRGFDSNQLSGLEEQADGAVVQRLAKQPLNKLFPELYEKDIEKNRLGSPDRIFDDMKEAVSHRNDPPDKKLKWLRDLVTNHGHWDFKDFYLTPALHTKDNPWLRGLPSVGAPQWAQEYGNFHYGAICRALGLSEEVTALGAGWAQLGGAEGKSLKSPEGAYNAAKNIALAAILPGYGDNRDDRDWVKAGGWWAKKHGF